MLLARPLAASGVTLPTFAMVKDRRAAPGARPVNHDVGHRPGRPHTDAEAGKLGVPDGKLLCLRLQAVDNTLSDPPIGHGAWPENPPGKHRGNTGKEGQGNSRKQDMLRNAHYKGILDAPGMMRKLKELAVLRMAFKRSGVRLPLAPPTQSLAFI
jgi:hypothetical protein